MFTKKYFILGVLLFFTGCAGSQEMRDEFANSNKRLFTDKEGRKFVVEHFAGDTYYVSPYKPEKEIP